MEISFTKPKENQIPLIQTLRDEIHEINSINTDISELLAKLRRYQNKILADETLTRQLALYIDPLTKSDPVCDNIEESRFCELSFDVKKHFLYSEDRETPKVLLLTGEAGIGKSFFCKNFQREILVISDIESEDPDERRWLPIYVDLSSLNNPKEEAVTETLIRELSLTTDEIGLLLTPKRFRNPLLPSLLLIFDGFNEIEALYHQQDQDMSQGVLDDYYLKENFYMSNKFGKLSEDARLIIACREENLQDIKRRDLLFAPIDENSSERSSIEGSFLERKIEPFNDEQITCYLKKYYISRETSITKESEEVGEPFSLASDSIRSLSWGWVKAFEELIENYKLRESARIPFILSTLTHVLPDIWGQENRSNLKPTESLTPRFLIEALVKKTLKSIVQNESTDAHREEAKLVEKRTKQVQILALKAGGYVLNTDSMSTEKTTNENDSLVSELIPLVKPCNNNFRFRFCHLFLEFFVSKSIEDEIIRVSNIPNVEEINAGELLLNQKLLTSKSSQYPIILFLRDALLEGRLTANHFLNLIFLSRPIDSEPQKAVDNSQGFFTSQSPFSVAAANAITILNVSGYDFSNQDFRKVCIPGANLSYGIFEGTDFTGANLRDVDFTSAWLKKAHLSEANLEGVEFGESPTIKFTGNDVSGIAYSANGKYFAVQTNDKVTIFENVGTKSLCWKELRSFPGKVPDNVNSPFSFDGKRFVAEENKNLMIWDTASGQLLQEINISARDSHKNILAFNVDHMDIFLYNWAKCEDPRGRSILKYDVVSDAFTNFHVRYLYRIPQSENSPKCRELMIFADRWEDVSLYNTKTGKCLLKQRQSTKYCKFSVDGNQILSTLDSETSTVSDMKRGYTLKSYDTERHGYSSKWSPWLYDDGKILIWATWNALNIHDAASAKRYSSIPLWVGYNHFEFSLGPNYCLSLGSNR
mgnify:FL=1